MAKIKGMRNLTWFSKWDTFFFSFFIFCKQPQSASDYKKNVALSCNSAQRHQTPKNHIDSH